MRTTITIDEQLLADVKRRAATTGQTISQVIEDAVRESLLRDRYVDVAEPEVDLPTWSGGGFQPGVDINDNAAVLDLMEDRW